VGVHGLNHDGKLYSSRAELNRRAQRIHGAWWGSVRRPCLRCDQRQTVHMLEVVTVLGKKLQAVLETDGGDPDVIGWA
jgi:hypothetical protein